MYRILVSNDTFDWFGNFMELAVTHRLAASALLALPTVIRSYRRKSGERRYRIEIQPALPLSGRSCQTLDNASRPNNFNSLQLWLIGYCQRKQMHLVPTREAQRFGPVRDREKLTAALRVLKELDRVKVIQEGQRIIIKVNPALLEVTSSA